MYHARNPPSVILKKKNCEYALYDDTYTLPLTCHTWSRPANMDGDVEIVMTVDQEMYWRRCESQTAITAVRAYICITKMKHQKLTFWKLHEPESLTALQHPIKSHVQPGAWHHKYIYIYIFLLFYFPLARRILEIFKIQPIKGTLKAPHSSLTCTFHSARSWARVVLSHFWDR